MLTKNAPASYEQVWTLMDPWERKLREQKLVATSTGPAVAALLLIPLVGLFLGVALAGFGFVISYVLARWRLTKRLFAGAPN